MDHPVLTAGLEQGVAALDPLPREGDDDLGVLELLGLVCARVPDLHRARAVLARRDLAVEVDVLERVVLGVDGEPILVRIAWHPARQRPRHQDAVALQAQVPMQAPRVVLLDHEARATSSVSRGAGRLRRRVERPLSPIALELVPGRHGVCVPVHGEGRVRRHRDRGRPGRRGRRRAARRQRPRGRDLRTGACRRRVLVLRVHALEGPGAAGRAGRRGSARPRGAPRVRPGGPGRSTGPARRGDPRPRRLGHGALARGPGHRADPGPRPARRRAPRGRRRPRTGRPQGGCGRDRERRRVTANRRPRRVRALDEPRGNDIQGGSGEPPGDRRWPRRMRAGSGVALVRIRRRAARGRRPDPRRRGAVRGRGGGLGAPANAASACGPGWRSRWWPGTSAGTT